jgi:DNA-binding FadR family transcriptional regulator
MQQEVHAAFQIETSGLSATQEVMSVLELRIALESEAAVLAAQRRTDEHLAAMRKALADMLAAIEKGEDSVYADMEFHRCIAEAAGNAHFLKLFNYVSEMLIPRSRRQYLRLEGTSMREYLDRTRREHEQICYAIERRDPEAARAALRLHLSDSRDRLQRSIVKAAGG